MHCVVRLDANQNFLSSFLTFSFPKHKYSVYVTVQNARWIDVNEMRNFLVTDVRDIKLIFKKEKRKNSCSTRDHGSKIIHCYSLDSWFRWRGSAHRLVL
jgi:hypothetical protein